MLPMQRPKNRGQQDQKAENYNAMIAIIAEKPSVARDIAGFLGANQKEEGVLSGNGYCVTWALGHLVSLALPEDYEDIAKGTLPILPDPFRLTIRKIKEGSSYVTDPKARRQLEIIASVFHRCDSIIVATDAGREGELIFRYIYEYLNCTKPFSRLWLSSLTEASISKAFRNIKPSTAFDSLFHAARARSRADWLIGINASQAVTSGVAGSYSLGRVQTPTLGMICRRFEENTNFKARKSWQILLQHQKELLYFKSLSEQSWDSRDEALKAIMAINKEGDAFVNDKKTTMVTEHPPLLHDLTSLQKEANSKLGLSAEQTLSIAQGLYEKRFITYPRTGSRYITEDMWEEIPTLVAVLHQVPRFAKATQMLKWGRLSRRIVDELKVTDHHALVITEKIPTALSVTENALYEMIAFRLLEAVGQPFLKEITTIKLESQGYIFRLKGVDIKEAGWRNIKGSFDDAQHTADEIPVLTQGEMVKIKTAELKEKLTVAPPLYTDGTLLEAMESAGKKLNDEDEREILKDSGIGTPATRASIIETLIDRGYAKRQHKAILPTDKGKMIYEMVKNMKIADVAMTAQWELALQEIETGNMDEKSFHEQIERYTSELTSELVRAAVRASDIPELPCPKCSINQIIWGDRLVKCSDISCGWMQFRNVCGVHLEQNEIVNLLVSGSTSLLQGLKSKSGKLFNARLILSDGHKVNFDFNQSKK